MCVVVAELTFVFPRLQALDEARKHAEAAAKAATQAEVNHLRQVLAAAQNQSAAAIVAAQQAAEQQTQQVTGAAQAQVQGQLEEIIAAVERAKAENKRKASEIALLRQEIHDTMKALEQELQGDNQRWSQDRAQIAEIKEEAALMEAQLRRQQQDAEDVVSAPESAGVQSSLGQGQEQEQEQEECDVEARRALKRMARKLHKIKRLARRTAKRGRSAG